MQTKATWGVLLAIGVVATSVVARSGLRSAPIVSAQSPPVSKEIPKFEVVPGWAKIPNGWVLGQVASAAADEKDHIWILHRPLVVRAGQKTGPPVMEFDQDGNYVQGWGGDGPGYDWPSSEHGIYVDPKGFVWIGGQGNEDQILKFTKAGKFVMQIGKGGSKKTNKDTKNFSKPADVFVYAKTNELFVADGYGNKRIIVFDADTGAYKRMWGAYGKPPEDDPPGAEAEGGGGTPAGGRGRGGRGANMSRVPAKDLADADPQPLQFSTIHGVKVS